MVVMTKSVSSSCKKNYFHIILKLIKTIQFDAHNLLKPQVMATFTE